MFKKGLAQTLLHDICSHFSRHPRVIFILWFLSKKILDRHVQLSCSFIGDLVLLSQGLRVQWRRKRARGWQTEEKALSAGCSGSSPLFREAGDTVPPPSRLVISHSFLYQLMRHERWGLRTEPNPAASSRHQSSELREARARCWPQTSQPSAAGTWNMRKTLEQCPPLFTLVSMKPFPVHSLSSVSSCVRSCKGL